MSAKQYNEWLKYKKWFDKQEAKGFSLSKKAKFMYKNFDKYAEAYAAQASIKEMDPDLYRDKSFADMIKSDSYEATSNQTHYFVGKIGEALNDLEDSIASGSSSAAELYNDFITKFGDIRKADEQELVYRRLKGTDMHYEYIDAKHHGWHGDLMDMMLYLQRSGVIDEIYV